MTSSHELLVILSRIERITNDTELPPTARLHDIREECHKAMVAAGWRVEDKVG